MGKGKVTRITIYFYQEQYSCGRDWIKKAKVKFDLDQNRSAGHKVFSAIINFWKNSVNVLEINKNALQLLRKKVESQTKHAVVVTHYYTFTLASNSPTFIQCWQQLFSLAGGKNMKKGKQALKRTPVVTGAASASSLSAPVSSLASFFEPVSVGIKVF